MGNVETLLALLYADGNGGGGGGGGTTNYNALTNRPKINGHVLEGDKTPEDLGIKGQAPDITVNASVDDTTGTPSVEVTKSGTDEAPIFEMAFTGLKGQTGQQGAPGAPGAPGPTGEDGFSPEITVEEITGGHRITITTKTGTESFDVMDGQGGGGGNASFDVATIPQGPTGNNEVNAVTSNGDNENAIVRYIRAADGTLPNTVNLGVKSALGEDSFQIPTVGYANSIDKFLFVHTDQDDWQDIPAQGEGVKGVELTTPYTYEELVASGKQIAAKIDSTSEKSDSLLVILQHYDDNARNRQFYGFSTYVDWINGEEHFYIDTVQIVKQTLTDKTWLYHRTSEISGGTVDAYTKAETDSLLANKQDKPVYVVDRPEGSNPVLGSVVQVGSFTNTDGTEYGIYEFYYKTSALPAADATKTYSFSPLLDNYTVFDFIDQSGITSNGHIISSGRTDGTNRIIIQQFSKNNRNVMLRAYGDFTNQTALLRIKFIGTKNA